MELKGLEWLCDVADWLYWGIGRDAAESGAAFPDHNLNQADHKCKQKRKMNDWKWFGTTFNTTFSNIATFWPVSNRQKWVKHKKLAVKSTTSELCIMQISAETHRKCDIAKVRAFYYHHHMKWEKYLKNICHPGAPKEKKLPQETEIASRNNRWSILTFILTISPFYFPFLPLYPDLTTPYVKC